MMGEGPGGGPPAEAPESENETPMVYLTPAQLGDRECKVGEKLTLTVTDVDPETGEVAAELSGGYENRQSPGGYEADFEDAIPEEE